MTNSELFGHGAATVLGATADWRSGYHVESVTDETVWSHLMQLLPTPQLPQSHAYGAAKAAKGWHPSHLLISDGSSPVAMATVLERRVGPVRVLARINRGPQFFAEVPDDAVIVDTYRTIQRRYRGPLLVASGLPNDARSPVLLRRAGFHQIRSQGWTSGRIDLRVSEEALWGGLASTFRNRVRQSEKKGALVRIANDEASYLWMIERHLENMRAKGFSAADAAMLQALRAASPEDVTVFQLLDGEKRVAGMSIVRFGRAAEYHVGWFGEEGRRLNAGNALMWAIIRELKQRGVDWFDVGGMREGDGYTQFKRTMRPREYSLAGEWGSL